MRRWVLLLALLTCAPGVSAQTLPSDLAENWRTSGKYFTWTSPLPENQGRTVQVFYTCIGDAAKPTVMMLHGFPTSSFDFRLLAHELEPDFRSCMLDFPGYGLSDKPLAGYRYTLTDDAQLVWHFVTKVVPLQQFVLFSHDRGDSVALNLLQLYQAASAPPFRITHQFLTNGNMYLPLANLTEFQKRMLDPATSAAAVKAANPTLLANGMGQTNFTPPLKPDDPEVRALAAFFGYQSGVEVIPATIQYLNERAKMEVSFLQTLLRSTIAATILWGVHCAVLRFVNQQVGAPGRFGERQPFPRVAADHDRSSLVVEAVRERRRHGTAFDFDRGDGEAVLRPGRRVRGLPGFEAVGIVTVFALSRPASIGSVTSPCS